MKRRVVALTLAISMLAASSAFAQADLGMKNLGVAVGFVSPENLDGTFSFGVFADHGTIAPRFGLESRIDYWGWSENAFGVETSIRDVALGARSKYHFEVASPSIRPFAGAGLAVHFLSVESTFPAGGGFPAMSVSGSETRLGLDVGGGIAKAINPRTDFLGEAWYSIVSDFSQFALRAGVSFKLGK